ncbi:type IV secretory system conjugative DNA transfer family protein [Streptomyces sp. NPDC060209]|uniref:type IV secretory system conjugative DNA transfer family protein n=1 Tax=Streptomyces sp. NPDC060209 TaxID=3347073 RepID=UPI0036523E4E
MMAAEKTGSSMAGLDDNTLLAAYGIGAAAAVGGAVLLAAPAAAVLSGRGWAVRTDSIPATVLKSLAKGPESAFTPAPPSWLFYGLTAVFVLAVLVRVWVIAPAGIPGRPTQKWSPVDYCTDAKAADRMASWMAEASSSGDSKRAAPWVDQAKSVLKGVLLAANLSSGGVPAMRRWLGLGKDAVDHVRAVLMQHGYNEVAEDYASPWLRLHEDGIGSIQFTLNVLARVYADEEVRETCSGTDFTVEELLESNGTVCLIASEADAERFAPLLTSVIASIIHGAEVRYNSTGKPLDPSLGLMVDEAGNMLRYPRLPNILTTGRGMGIDVLTVWHDLSQLRDRLGTQKSNTVLSASGLRMLLPGCGDLETLRYFSGLYGRTEVMKTSHGRSRGEYSTNTSATETDLAPVHSLQQLPDFTAIAQYSNQPPIKVRMRLTFRDKDLKKLLAAPGPDSGGYEKTVTHV